MLLLLAGQNKDTNPVSNLLYDRKTRSVFQHNQLQAYNNSSQTYSCIA